MGVNRGGWPWRLGQARFGRGREEGKEEELAGRPHPDGVPTHPGEILREDMLPALGEPAMTVAKKLGVTRQRAI